LHSANVERYIQEFLDPSIHSLSRESYYSSASFNSTTIFDCKRARARFFINNKHCQSFGWLDLIVRLAFSITIKTAEKQLRNPNTHTFLDDSRKIVEIPILGSIVCGVLVAVVEEPRPNNIC